MGSILRQGAVLLRGLKWVAAAATFFCKKISVEPKKTTGTIVVIFGKAVALACVCSDIFRIFWDRNIVAEGLDFLQTREVVLCWIIIIVAVLPPAAALLERKEAATWKYIVGNLIFNLVGAGCACWLLRIAYMTIENFSFLREFYVAEIAVAFIPLCLWIALSYQQVEQEEQAVQNHATSLKWINQILNLLHLVNVYFWSLVSTELIICYTLYCYIHHVPQTLSTDYLVAISVILVFFDLCGLHKHKHLYLLFLAAVPAILICTVQWMSWFVVEDNMVGWQLLFIVFHFACYMLVIYLHEKEKTPKGEQKKFNPMQKAWIEELKAKEDQEHEEAKVNEPHKRAVPVLGKWFYFVVFVILTISYIIFWIVPPTLERVPYSAAVNHICSICDDTAKSESLLMGIRESEWYDGTVDAPDIDKTQYLIFLYENLKEEMVGKSVITAADSAVSYQRLLTWYNLYDGREASIGP